MAQRLNVQRVCVVGAGVSGVSAAIYLKRAGLDVTVFERNAKPGGVWVYDERSAHNPEFPSTTPSVGDSPEFDLQHSQPEQIPRHDSPLSTPPLEKSADLEVDSVLRSFAPPGPAYFALKNNVSTIELELPFQKWQPSTEEIVPHHVLAGYIQDIAQAYGVEELTSFNTRIQHFEKVEDQWQVDFLRLERHSGGPSFLPSREHFDAVVVAAGHYHAPNVPSIEGLADWKKAFPDRVLHSKLYRRPEAYKGQNVLLIGSGVSSMDIARDLGVHARAIYQSSRGGPYDLPSHMLPDNGSRIGGISSFDTLKCTDLESDRSIPATVTLVSGQRLCNIHSVIVCAGYHVSLPFAKQYHADGVKPENADEQVIVTDGVMTHNLHKDIFHIQDPTLAFIGVPYHVATFSLYAFQAAALAQVFAGNAPLPSSEEMRKEYNDRIREKGVGRGFHSLRETGAEVRYVNDLCLLVNRGREGEPMMQGHTETWLEAYGRRDQKKHLLRSRQRDLVLDERARGLMNPCS